MPDRKSTTAGPGLQRRPVGLAGDADQAGHRLDRQIHRQIVTVGTAQAISRARGINQPRVDLVQNLEADAEPVHHPRRKVLQQHVALRGHAEQQLLAALVLEVESDRALVRVEHRDRKCRAHARRGATAQRLTVGRLDLDHVRAGRRHQQGRVRTLIDLPEIEHRDAGQRHVGACHFFICHSGMSRRGRPGTHERGQ